MTKDASNLPSSRRAAVRNDGGWGLFRVSSALGMQLVRLFGDLACRSKNHLSRRAHLVIGVDVGELQYAVSIDDIHRWYRQHVVGLAGCLFQIDAAEAIAGDQRIIDGIADAECADRRSVV